LDEALQAKRDGVDYLVFSPVFPTSSKPDHPGAGLMALRAVCERAAPLPVMALGGVTPEGTGDCLDTGASGVAVLSGILAAADPPQAVRAYLRALNTHPTPSASPGAN
jgi:thiamine-phosphate pyrophosphorylase